LPSDNDFNATLTPNIRNNNPNVSSVTLNDVATNINTVEIDSGNSGALSDLIINLEEIFPAPGVIVKNLYNLYICNKPTKERESTLLNYVKLLFSKSI